MIQQEFTRRLTVKAQPIGEIRAIPAWHIPLQSHKRTTLEVKSGLKWPNKSKKTPETRQTTIVFG